MSYDPAVLGTVADWTESLLTGLSVLTAVVYYFWDRRRVRRAHAGSVFVWLHPHEHGPPVLKTQNLRTSPAFDHGFLNVAR